MPLDGLPGWVIDDDASVRREVQGGIGRSDAERWAITRLCARDALWATRLNPEPERVLAFQEPLPATTIAALARLRARRRTQRHDGERP